MRKLLLATISMIMLLGTALLGGCCSPRVVENTVIQTDTVSTVDSVLVYVRSDTVKIEIPASSKSIVTNDTASHLQDGLYESDAYWDGQFLHHSLNSILYLFSIQGAQLTKIIHHTDTVKIKEKAESHNKDKSRKETVYVQPSMKDKAGYVAIGFVLAVILGILYGARKKIAGIFKKLG